MITRECVNRVYDFFESYISKFEFSQDEKEGLLVVKYNHTMRVKDLCVEIARDVFDNEEDVMLAELIGLLHDIGRWKQYYLYKTFYDYESINHAQASCDIVVEEKILEELEEREKNIVTTSIFEHNKKVIEDQINNDVIRFVHVIRDADKLDNYDVHARYKEETKETQKMIDCFFEDTKGVSNEVYEEVLRKKVIDRKHLNNANDHTFSVLSWVFDFNFSKVFKLVRDRSYVDKIYDRITGKDDRTEEMYRVLKAYVEENSK